MLKKVLHKAAKLTAALILTAGIFSGCSDALDVTAGKGTDAAESIRSVYKDECTSNPVCAEDMSSSASDGTWVRAYKTSNGQKVYHTSAPVYSSTVGGTYKFAITAGRWEVKLYRRFKGAESSSAFEFDVYGRRNADSDPQMSLKEINVFDDSGNSTGTSIFSTRTSLSKDYNNFTHIKTSALGRSSGWLEFKFDAESAAAGSDSLYFDNISFNKKDEKIFKISTSSSTAWSQTGKFQFKIDEALSGTKKVSFDLLPCSNATSLTVRGVDTTTKWIDSQKITNLNEWYHVEFTSTITAPGIGITVYISSKSTSQTVYIKNFKINDTAYTSLPASPYADSPAVINYAIVTKVEKEAEEPVSIFDDSRLNEKSKFSSGTISEIDFLTAGPAHDAAHGVTISWQAPTPYCVLEISGKNAVIAKGTPSELPWSKSDDGTAYLYKFYTYSEEITGLSSGTTYNYKVYYKVNGQLKNTSGEHKFKTATNGNSFKFMVLSDLHRGKDSNDSMDNLKTTISAVGTKSSSTDFTIFNGDMVNKGYYYTQWKDYNNRELLTGGIVGFTAGNHEYKPESSSNIRSTRKFFTTMAAIPKETLKLTDSQKVGESNYWFMYNKVLFIVTDSSSPEYSNDSNADSSSKQAAWIKAVADANAGKYDFAIAIRHIPHYFLTYDKKAEKIVEKAQSSSVMAAYDYAGVDLVITSDHHAYNRSYPIYNGKVVNKTSGEITNTSKNRGSVYVVTPMTQGSSLSKYIGDSSVEFDSSKTYSSGYRIFSKGLEKIAKYDHGTKETDNDKTGGKIPPKGNIGASVGGCYVEVSGSKMTFNYVARDKNGDTTVIDSITINKRSR